MTTSSSYSPVEHVFSILTTIMMDQWLTMAHKTMEDCTLIAGNKNAWTSKKRRKLSTLLPQSILVQRSDKKDLGKGKA